MRVFREMFDALQGVDGGEVAKGKDVGPLEDKDEVYVDGPIANTFHGGKGGADLFVRAFWPMSPGLLVRSSPIQPGISRSPSFDG